MNRVVLKLFMFLFVCLSLLTGFSFANKLTFQSNVVTGKYFCSINVDVKANYIAGHDTFTDCFYVVKYNPENENLTWKLKGQNVQGHDREVNNGGLLEIQENFKAEKNSTQVCSTLLLTGINPGTSTILSFVNKGGVLLTPSEWCSTCGLRLDHGSENTLTDASDQLILNYETCPCTLDGQNPLWKENEVKRSDNKTTSISGDNLVGQLTVTGLIVDWKSTEKWGYWFSGNDTSVVTNYVSVPNSLKSKIDNQFGVDSGTIKVVIHYDDFYGVDDDIFSLTENNLNISDYVGSDYGYQTTWNNNRRGYWINFTNSTGYQVERQVDIYVYAGDNGLNMGSVCTHKVNSGEIVHYTINKAVSPTIQWLSPTSGDAGVNPNLTVSMKLSDTWAGIDTGSLIVWATYPVWSGESDSEIGERITKTFEYSGDFFTGGMFVLTGGLEGLGNSGSYEVTFTLTGLTEQTGITLSGYVKDLAGNSTGSQITFETREPCSNFGCRDTFEIKWFDWIDQEWLNKIFPDGTGSVIILVTGSNEISFSGDGNPELMCGGDVESAYLTGNIKIFDENGELISADIDITRKGELYFSGLDVEYDADNNYVNIMD